MTPAEKTLGFMFGSVSLCCSFPIDRTPKPPLLCLIVDWPRRCASPPSSSLNPKSLDLPRLGWTTSPPLRRCKWIPAVKCLSSSVCTFTVGLSRPVSRSVKVGGRGFHQQSSPEITTRCLTFFWCDFPPSLRASSVSPEIAPQIYFRQNIFFSSPSIFLWLIVSDIRMLIGSISCSGFVTSSAAWTLIVQLAQNDVSTAAVLKTRQAWANALEVNGWLTKPQVNATVHTDIKCW